MGMFDSLYDADGNEWQTKAFGCVLAEYRVGDKVPALRGSDARSFQIEVLGGPGDGFHEAFATVADGVLVAVPADRDRDFGNAGYFGGPPLNT